MECLGIVVTDSLMMSDALVLWGRNDGNLHMSASLSFLPKRRHPILHLQNPSPVRRSLARIKGRLLKSGHQGPLEDLDFLDGIAFNSDSAQSSGCRSRRFTDC